MNTGESPGHPAVSIVTIFLNAEEFIQESIESVLAQRFTSWELLLVDDGSTDRSSEIAKWYSAKYPSKVKYLEHGGRANRGMSASRNLALRHARGEFISLLDSDDAWLPWTLEEQVATLRAYPTAAMARGATQYWFSWERDRESHSSYLDVVDTPAGASGGLIQAPHLLLALLRGRVPTLCTCSVIMRRRETLEVGGFVDAFSSLYEDQAFFAKVLVNYPVVTVASCWGRYRQHARSSCAKARAARTDGEARLAYLTWLERYLSGTRIEHPELRKALEVALSARERPSLTRGIDVALQRALSKRLYGRLKRWYRLRYKGLRATPLVPTSFRGLRRATPISPHSEDEHGFPVGRYYDEHFLARCSGDIRGHVLETRDDAYTRRFGGSRVTRSDVLHPVEGHPRATLVADLTSADSLPADRFDCVICAQELAAIYDVRAAIRTLYRILRPGGALLVTVPGVSRQISRRDMSRGEDYWRFTTLSARRLFEEVFPPSAVRVEARGNVLSAVALLHGLAAEEFLPDELDHVDPDYEVSISVRATKPVP